MPIRVSSWLNVATAAALVVAVGVIVEDRTEVISSAKAAVSNDSQQLRLEKLERDVAALSARPRTDEHTQSDLAARLEWLEEEIARVSAQMSSTGATRAGTVSAGPIEQERQRDEPDQRAIETLENAFASESTDVNGSMAAAVQLSNVIHDMEFENTHVSEVVCQSTLCRINVSHADTEADILFTQSLNRTDEFNESESYVQHLPSNNGGVNTVIYVSRAGHHLPVPPRS